MKKFCTCRCFTLESKNAKLEELSKNEHATEIDVGFVSDYGSQLFYYLVSWYEV